MSEFLITSSFKWERGDSSLILSLLKTPYLWGGQVKIARSENVSFFGQATLEVREGCKVCSFEYKPSARLPSLRKEALNKFPHALPNSLFDAYEVWVDNLTEGVVVLSNKEETRELKIELDVSDRVTLNCIHVAPKELLKGE